MKFLVVIFFAIHFPAQANTTALEKKVEEAARKQFQSDTKISVKIVKNTSICGSELCDAVIADVMQKKIGRDQNGNQKDAWDIVETYSATLKDFEKNGSKAFMRDGQCAE